MGMEEKIRALRAEIDAAAREAGRDPAAITLEAATKTQTADTVRAAIAGGITLCGENRVQELTQKLDQFAYDGTEVHFIGHLQKNKIKQVVGRVDMIESIDSMELLEAVSAYAQKLELRQDILLEVNIAAEASKHGFRPEEVFEAAQRATKLEGVRLRGLMCIPPKATEPDGNSKFFAKTYQLFVDIKAGIGDNSKELNCLSMGMSGDFADAVRHGATIVRVGTGLFGPRG